VAISIEHGSAVELKGFRADHEAGAGNRAIDLRPLYEHHVRADKHPADPGAHVAIADVSDDSDRQGVAVRRSVNRRGSELIRIEEDREILGGLQRHYQASAIGAA
jgi:hypothetical protein